MNCHLEVWGSTTVDHIKKLDNMLVNIAKTIHKNIIGKTEDYYLNLMKWDKHQIRYDKAISKVAFKLLNNEKTNPHRLHSELING